MFPFQALILDVLVPINKTVISTFIPFKLSDSIQSELNWTNWQPKRTSNEFERQVLNLLWCNS